MYPGPNSSYSARVICASAAALSVKLNLYAPSSAAFLNVLTFIDYPASFSTSLLSLGTKPSALVVPPHMSTLLSSCCLKPGSIAFTAAITTSYNLFMVYIYKPYTS